MDIDKITFETRYILACIKEILIILLYYGSKIDNTSTLYLYLLQENV